VLRCLEKDREKRFRDVGQLAVALGSFAPKRARSSVDRVLRTLEASGKPVAQSPPSGPGRAAFADTVSVNDARERTNASWGHTGGTRKGRRDWRTLVGVGAGVGIAAIVGVVAMTPRSREPAASAAPPTASSASGGLLAQPAPLPAPTQTPSATSTAEESSTAPALATAAPKLTVPTRASAHPAATSAPSATAVRGAAAAPTCRIVTDYDNEGQPHFKKVCN
jgi:hypothetical protein